MCVRECICICVCVCVHVCLGGVGSDGILRRWRGFIGGSRWFDGGVGGGGRQ